MRNKANSQSTLENELVLEGPLADSILDTLLQKEIPIDHSCGGNAACGTCRIVILSGGENLNQRTTEEQDFIEGRGWREEERLACQCLLNKGTLSLKIPQ